jgi:hypothetical protein
MNLTLSIDEQLVKRARKSAAAMGKSLNQVVREFLESLTEQGNADDFERELRQLSARAGGRRRGWHFDRNEAHARS